MTDAPPRPDRRARRWRLRPAHPPLARVAYLWAAVIGGTAAAASFLHVTSPAPFPPTTLHVVLPPLLLLYLLAHPAARGLAHVAPGTPARARLDTSPEAATDALRHHRRLAAAIARGRLGPVWLRCAVGALLATMWAREMGWLGITGSRWYPLAPDERRFAEGMLLAAAFGALAAFFATHLAVWERHTLGTRRLRTLHEVAAFARALLRAALIQLVAALASMMFGLLALLLLFLVMTVLALFDTLREPAWFAWVLRGARPRTELLLLALPGMLARAVVELRHWREELLLRLQLLAREVDRERGADATASIASSRTRLASGRAIARRS